jgi:ABC-type branched-subunit amino acid transport system permease subunit
MSPWIKNIIAGLVVVGILYLVNATMTPAGLFGIGIDDYQARLLVFIAINIILATSLNLINGFTGQFPSVPIRPLTLQLRTAGLLRRHWAGLARWPLLVSFYLLLS